MGVPRTAVEGASGAPGVRGSAAVHGWPGVAGVESMGPASRSPARLGASGRRGSREASDRWVTCRSHRPATRRVVRGRNEMPRRRPGPPPPTGEAPAVARHGPRGGPYSLQRRGCVLCHTSLRHDLVACCTNMDEQRFHAVTCLSRRSAGDDRPPQPTAVLEPRPANDDHDGENPVRGSGAGLGAREARCWGTTRS